MAVWDGWEKMKVPLGLVATVAMAGYAVYSYADRTFLKVGDFKGYQHQIEIRMLNQQKLLLETDVLRLTVKRNLKPETFDAVDKTILDKQEKMLEETKEEMIRLERRRQRDSNGN